MCQTKSTGWKNNCLYCMSSFLHTVNKMKGNSEDEWWTLLTQTVLQSFCPHLIPIIDESDIICWLAHCAERKVCAVASENEGSWLVTVLPLQLVHVGVLSWAFSHLWLLFALGTSWTPNPLLSLSYICSLTGGQFLIICILIPASTNERRDRCCRDRAGGLMSAQ